ncbi:MAG: hypothetical protein HY986_09730 [Candidatus Melainabacteria bacterium]|nr:hypothetical protein [Candidatus Melainabacteria bacterium]
MTNITHLFSLNWGLTMTAVGLVLTGLWLAAVRLRTSSLLLYPDSIGQVSVALTWRETVAGMERVLKEKHRLLGKSRASIEVYLGQPTQIWVASDSLIKARYALDRLFEEPKNGDLIVVYDGPFVKDVFRQNAIVGGGWSIKPDQVQDLYHRREALYGQDKDYVDGLLGWPTVFEWSSQIAYYSVCADGKNSTLESSFAIQYRDGKVEKVWLDTLDCSDYPDVLR